MSWLYSGDADNSNVLITVFEVANLISGIILLLTTVVLMYFLKKKTRDSTDHIICVVASAICLLGIKNLITISIQKWAAYPVVCTMVDVGIANALLILIWLLPPLILRILAAVSREELLIELIGETKSKIKAQDSATSLEIKNSELQTLIFKFDTILNIKHRLGNQADTFNELRNVISSSGVLRHGD